MGLVCLASAAVEVLVAVLVVELGAEWVVVSASPKVVRVWGSRCRSRSSNTAAEPATTKFPMLLLLWSNRNLDQSRATAAEAGARGDSEDSMW